MLKNETYAKKDDFVNDLKALLVKHNISDVTNLEYVIDERPYGNEEYVNVFYKGGFRSVCVTGDSCLGILVDLQETAL